MLLSKPNLIAPRPFQQHDCRIAAVQVFGNQIPPHIRNLRSAPAVRKALKTYLFSQL